MPAYCYDGDWRALYKTSFSSRKQEHAISGVSGLACTALTSYAAVVCVFQIHSSKHCAHGAHLPSTATLRALWFGWARTSMSTVVGRWWSGNLIVSTISISQGVSGFYLFIHNAKLCVKDTNNSEWKPSPFLATEWYARDMEIESSICMFLCFFTYDIDFQTQSTSCISVTSKKKTSRTK